MKFAANFEQVDTTFDLRTDSRGKDPDLASPTLRRYHQQLWSKPLPSGQLFTLDRAEGYYLHHSSSLGEFWLASDALVQTFLYWQRFAPIARTLNEGERRSFDRLASTVGAFTIFPGQRVNGRLTINGARGLKREIADRLDLTLECIRRHYCGQSSPLADTLARYGDFFDLFRTFRGYVDFFLFQDLLTSEGLVQFFLPFDDFRTAAVPSDIDSYRSFRRASMSFVKARNRRIRDSQGPAGALESASQSASSTTRQQLVMGRMRSRRSRPLPQQDAERESIRSRLLR